LGPSDGNDNETLLRNADTSGIYVAVDQTSKNQRLKFISVHVQSRENHLRMVITNNVRGTAPVAQLRTDFAALSH
jgi:hypothetical protein